MDKKYLPSATIVKREQRTITADGVEYKAEDRVLLIKGYDRNRPVCLYAKALEITDPKYLETHPAKGICEGYEFLTRLGL